MRLDQARRPGDEAVHARRHDFVHVDRRVQPEQPAALADIELRGVQRPQQVVLELGQRNLVKAGQAVLAPPLPDALAPVLKMPALPKVPPKPPGLPPVPPPPPGTHGFGTTGTPSRLLSTAKRPGKNTVLSAVDVAKQLPVSPLPHCCVNSSTCGKSKVGGANTPLPKYLLPVSLWEPVQ